MKYRILIGIIIISTTFACLYNNYKAKTYYLSYSTTEFNNNKQEIMNIYSLNITNGNSTKVAQLPYYASYPTAIYDQKNNCVYYSNNQKSNDYSDWVMKYDCANKTSEIFIDQFKRINDILLDNNKNLCIVGNTKNDDVIHPYIYDIKSHTLNKIDLNEDMCFKANYNCYKNEYLFTGHNDNLSRKMMEKYNNTSHQNESDFNIDNHIYKYKNKVELLKTVSTGNIPLITDYNDSIIYGKLDGFEMENIVFKKFNGDDYKLDHSIIGLIQFLDDSNLLCVATTTYSEGIYIYNVDTQTFDKCLFNSNTESITSISLIQN